MSNILSPPPLSAEQLAAILWNDDDIIAVGYSSRHGYYVSRQFSKGVTAEFIDADVYHAIVDIDEGAAIV